MQTASFEEAVAQIVARDRRYPREAYCFLREALEVAQRPRAKEPRKAICHVTGQQLLEALRDHARHQFGPLARLVLSEWGVRCCEDFGEIVFNMVEAGLLSKTDKDSRNDFKDGYDFFEAFTRPYLPKARLFPAVNPAEATPPRSLP